MELNPACFTKSKYSSLRTTPHSPSLGASRALPRFTPLPRSVFICTALRASWSRLAVAVMQEVSPSITRIANPAATIIDVFADFNIRIVTLVTPINVSNQIRFWFGQIRSGRRKNPYLSCLAQKSESSFLKIKSTL